VILDKLLQNIGTSLMKTRQTVLHSLFLMLTMMLIPCAQSQDCLRWWSVPLAGQELNAIKTSWPGIGCWFWSAAEFEPDGYMRFIDLHVKHSAFALLTTSIRHNVEVTQLDVHDQIKRAAIYAREHGMHIVMDLDIRLARQAFMNRYPDEMQEIVRLRELALPAQGQASMTIESFKTGDHYTPTGVRPYESIAGRLLRAFSYISEAQGIVPATIEDITNRCQVSESAGHSLTVTIPCSEPDKGRTVCLMASFTLFAPDVFAPHLIEFERHILQQYADVPLAGACKDEWGFPGRFSPRLDDLYFSVAMAKAYAHRRPGHDLIQDILLMFKPQPGHEAQRVAAVNHYMEMIWQRNAEIENGYYRSIKNIFGARAMSATHPTWYPNPATKEEVFKNGLDWWACKRDLAQVDESTPLCARTALAKKWHSPLWFNMFYERTLAPYHVELWSSVLAGGRINFHPIYPSPKGESSELRAVSLLSDQLLAADRRIGLLNFISTAPIHCPVAVVFGHPAALNWTDTGLADVGLGIINSLYAEGFYADLIPSSEITAGNLRVAKDGHVQYGRQTYAALLLYHPQYERPAVAEFCRTAAEQGKTALYQVGDWSLDFDGKPFDIGKVSAQLKRADSGQVADEIINYLQMSSFPRQTRCSLREYFHSKTMMPSPSGQCRLLDGTVILASGEKDVMGDTIRQTIAIDGHQVTFDAIGVASVRVDKSGAVQAVACGGLRRFQFENTFIDLPERIDMAMWRDEEGQWQGVVQGYSGQLPEALLRLTKKWIRLCLPVILDKDR
jgi:hypothetical protein